MKLNIKIRCSNVELTFKLQSTNVQAHAFMTDVWESGVEIIDIGEALFKQLDESKALYPIEDISIQQEH